MARSPSRAGFALHAAAVAAVLLSGFAIPTSSADAPIPSGKPASTQPTEEVTDYLQLFDVNVTLYNETALARFASEKCVDTSLKYALCGGNASCSTLRTLRGLVAKDIETRWQDACNSTLSFFQAFPNGTFSDLEASANAACFDNISLPLSGQLFLDLLNAEKGLCHCLGGEVVSGPLSGLLECSEDIQCYLDADACFGRSPPALGGEFERCSRKIRCSKHVSHVRGLLVEAALRTQMGDDTCVKHWQTCTLSIEACVDHTCPLRAVSPLCGNKEFCKYAAASAAALSPMVLTTAVATAVALLLIL